MRRFVGMAALVLTLIVPAACGDDPAADATLLVFAAASLTDAFAEVGEAFEAANDGVRVQLSFAGSSSLREQILDGAPADVFASANEATMDQLVEAGAVEAPTAFATNELQIVVPAGNPAGVRGIEDLADPDLLIGLCAEGVPCGDLARQVLVAAGVTPAVDTDEPDPRALLTKVGAGELDAGLVYVTDVASGGAEVEGIDLPPAARATTRYPIAPTASSGNQASAAAFVEFVLGDEGQAILRDHGFGRP